MVKLWMTIALVIYASLVKSSFSEETFDCPKGCRCQSYILSVIMKCKSLAFDNISNVPVSHFEINQSEQPLSMKKSIFIEKGLKHVNSITISSSSVLTIDQFAFEELKDLTDLKMTHANISNIHPDIFQNNTNLRKLSLAGNPLNETETFLKSWSIEEFDMSYCNLTRITPNRFRNLKNLKFLDLTGNNIQNLTPGSFDHLTELVELKLSNNLLSRFPNNIFVNNDLLDILDLSKNPISEFSLKGISSLSVLNLSACKLETISADMFAELENLANLDLSYNQITYIHPFAFQTFNSLDTINLSNNELSKIDDRVFNFRDSSHLVKISLENNRWLKHLPYSGFKTNNNVFNVYHFTCSNCGLEDLSKDTFRNMPAIVTLDLSRNKISDISTGVFQSIPGLIDLDLSHNQISTVDSDTFKKNKNLISLTLSGNPLKALHTSMFTNNKNIQKLDLSNCGLFKLWTLPANPEKLSSITTLNISNNKINIITANDIAVTNNLESLDLSGNPLVCTDSIKTLIEYLTYHEIQDTEIQTHADMAHDIEELKLDLVVWKERAKLACPNLFTKEVNISKEDIETNIHNNDNFDHYSDDDQANEEDSDEDIDDDEEEDGIIDDSVDADEVLQKLNRDSIHLLPKIEEKQVDEKHLFLFASRHTQYSYLWPVLVFIGTAVAVLVTVANTILFIIRRRQNIPVSTMIKSRGMSKLKKNSGLVYQQLSEERGGPKTPILSRFGPLPTVHSSRPTAPESV